ncbi:LPS-assembly protein LptD @ Organic solvent tolerance protein precursor [Olavius algarvensis associated proteobacterium Delta 3]|nr:LPS-assembly protein LptD @ Organic solvent tolerance protein precursor [Olavius algarvensis associated proteobacterium Delta 3]
MLLLLPCDGISSDILPEAVDGAAPWNLLADEIRYDEAVDRYIARGNVIVSKGSLRISADEIRFDHRQMTIDATGNVTLSSGDDMLRASRVTMDLDREVGTLTDASIFFSQQHFYIRGQKILKTGKNTYSAERASATTCDGEPPAWKITGRKLNVTLEGYGKVRNATFRVRNIPILWAPYLVFPVKIARQSGFLTPQFGISERKGYQLAVPYYWAIRDNMDATVYADFMTERGFKIGGEYRYVLSPRTFGTVMLDYLDDRQVDDGQGDSSQRWGYTDDSVLRPNSDRYWFRMKHNQPLPGKFTGRLDLDIVSDQDYLQEFKSGYSGFEDTRFYFREAFSRDINDFTNPIRANELNVNRTWLRYSLNTGLRWNEDSRNRALDQPDQTLQQLPVVLFDGSRQPIFRQAIYWDFQSSFNNFYRQTGDRGQRIDLFPRFYYPYRLRNIMTLEPSVGLRETAWYINAYAPGTPDKNSAFHRESFDFRLDASTDISRVYPVRFGPTDRLRHLSRFQAVYDYVPDQDQGELPLFDGTDRIEKVNQITYSWTNTLTGRSRSRVRTEEPSTRFLYNDLLRLQVTQIYDVNKGTSGDPEPFSPIDTLLDLNLTSYLTLRAATQFSVYGSGFTGHNLSATAQSRRGDRLYLDYLYARDEAETLTTELLVPVFDRVALLADYEQNLFNRTNIKTGLGVQYRAQCWSIVVRYVEEAEAPSVTFEISLTGLGGIASGVGLSP